MFRSRISRKSDFALVLTHCSNTWRTLRRSSMRRVCPSQFQRWSLARRAISINGSRASSAINLPDTLESIFVPLRFPFVGAASVDDDFPTRADEIPQLVRELHKHVCKHARTDDFQYGLPKNKLHPAVLTRCQETGTALCQRKWSRYACVQFLGIAHQ